MRRVPPPAPSQAGRLWLALWSSRLSRHVLLRFVLAPRGACPAVSVPAQRPAQRVVPLVPLAPLAPLAPPAPCRVRSAPSFLIIRGQDITRTTKTTREAGQRCRPGRLHNGTHSALQRDLGEDVVAQVAQRSAGVGQLGAAQVDLVVRHRPDELKDLLPAGDEARAQHVVHAEGLGGRGGRRSRG